MHWKDFIKQEIGGGRFATASEVVRAALRESEDRGKRLEVLRSHLSEGAGQEVESFHFGVRCLQTAWRG